MVKAVIMHQAASDKQQATDVHHPGFCAIHLHKQQQDEGRGDVFDRIAVNADSALQLGKSAVTVRNAVERSEAHNVK